jgi:hypothetical protein
MPPLLYGGTGQISPRGVPSPRLCAPIWGVISYASATFTWE